MNIKKFALHLYAKNNTAAFYLLFIGLLPQGFYFAHILQPTAYATVLAWLIFGVRIVLKYTNNYYLNI